MSLDGRKAEPPDKKAYSPVEADEAEAKETESSASTVIASQIFANPSEASGAIKSLLSASERAVAADGFMLVAAADPAEIQTQESKALTSPAKNVADHTPVLELVQEAPAKIRDQKLSYLQENLFVLSSLVAPELLKDTLLPAMKEQLIAEAEAQMQTGKFSPADKASLEAKINAGEIPDVLVKSLLAREYGQGVFGPGTQAVYAAVIASQEQQAADNFLKLAASGLPIPPGSPVPMRLNQFGRPEVEASVRAGLINGEYRPSFGLDSNKVPEISSLATLLRSARWNQDATKIHQEYIEAAQMKLLQEAVVKLGRKEWLPKENDNKQEWMLRAGPLVDLATQIKAEAQALALAKKLSAGNEINFDRQALTSKFPGSIKFDKDGRIVGMELALPDSLSPSWENNRRIAKLEAWRQENAEPARRAMEELALAAVQQDRLLLWQDLPNAGEHKNNPYTLECHRYSVENVTVGGEPKIRVRNRVDYYQSDWYNFYDIGSTKIGSDDCQSVDPQKRSALEEQFKAGTLPTEQMKELNDALAKGGHVYAEKLDELAGIPYRDYGPTDLVVVMKDGKMHMVMAGELEALRAGQERSQNLAMLGLIGLDLVFTATAIFGIGAALKAAHVGGRLAGAAANAALRRAAQQVVKRELMHGAKGLVLGGSGVVFNNSYWQSSEIGRSILLARNIAFVADGLHGGYLLTKQGVSGGLRLAGLKEAASITAEAKALERVTKLAHSWKAPADATALTAGLFKTASVADASSRALMLGGECYMATTLLGENWKSAGELLGGEGQPNLVAAGKILRSLHSNQSDAARFLQESVTKLAGQDFAKQTILGDLVQQHGNLEKLTPAEKQEQINSLIKKYDQTKNQQEKILLATSLLFLSSSEDAKQTLGIRDVKVWQGSGRGAGSYVTKKYAVSAGEFISQLERGIASNDGATKLFAAQALVGFNKMNLSEYAVCCKEVLAANVLVDTKIQAIAGLTSCIEGLLKQKDEALSVDERLKNLNQSYGCSPEHLQKALIDVASTDSSPEVRAMSAFALKALTESDPILRNKMLATNLATFKAVAAHKRLENVKAESEKLEPEARGEKKKQLELETQNYLQTRKVLSVIQNPQLAERISGSGDLGLIESQLIVPPASLAQDFYEKSLADLRLQLPEEPEQKKEAVIKKLEALRLLELTGTQLSPEVRQELDALLIDELVSMDNGRQAITATKMLIPSRLPELSEEQKSSLVQSLHDILNRPHLPSTDSDKGEHKRCHEAASVKEELLQYLPTITAGNLFNDGEKSALILELTSLVDNDSSNLNRATPYPSLRIAAIERLSELDRTPATVNLLKENMKSDSNAAVRQATFLALKKLGDPELLKLVQENMTNERDPALSSLYAEMDFASLRPDRPESAERIFQYEVDYWQQMIERSTTKQSPAALKAYLQEKYPHTEPERMDQIYNEAERNLSVRLSEIKNDFYWFGWFRSARQADMDAAPPQYRDPYKQGRVNNWTTLVKDAQGVGEGSDKARAALLYLATNGIRDALLVNGETPKPEPDADRGGLQHEAAKTIRELIKNNCPNKELLYSGLIDAWKTNDLTSHPHEARQEILFCIQEMLEAKPAKISKQVAGRILHEALREEIRMMNAKEPKVDDFREISRQKQIINLMQLSEYSLSMAELKALSDSRSKANVQVKEAARSYLAHLYNSAPKVLDLPERANNLQAALEERMSLLQGMAEETARQQNDQRSEEQKFIDQNKISGKDAQSTRNAIIRACAGSAIRASDDPRIPVLRNMLKDPDKGVALTAAWFLVDSFNPQNTNDHALRLNLSNQEYFKDSLKTLEAVTKSGAQHPNDLLWKADAQRYLDAYKAWMVGGK
ncbi:MAG: HEAT repeat domain-containing protein [Candidatus Obscuribacterales bacterium]|nr:HEAT repeat domain-containing protein [Candidatus Obscuribacterales bacterium]